MQCLNKGGLKMNYNKLTKKELIERLELLENAVIGVQVIHDANAIIITPDPEIKNSTRQHGLIPESCMKINENMKASDSCKIQEFNTDVLYNKIISNDSKINKIVGN